MKQFLQKVTNLVVGDPSSVSFKLPKNRPLKQLTERELLRLESQVGSTVFGPVPVGHRREFFCFDEKTWIWYEEWTDEKGVRRETTTRYEVHDKGILKVQEGARYSYIEGKELENLMMATRIYYEKVAREVYNRDPQTGQKFA